MSLVGLFKVWTGVLANYVEIAAAAIIGVAAVEATARAFWLFVQRQLPPEAKEDLRLRLARWLAVALELELGADILRTAIEPTWNELGLLAAIAAIRTALNYFLEKEIQRAAARTAGSPTAGNFAQELQRNREVARQTGQIAPSANTGAGEANLNNPRGDGREDGHVTPRQPATP